MPRSSASRLMSTTAVLVLAFCAAAHGARHQQDEAPSVAYCKALMAKLVPEFKGGFYGTLFCPSDDAWNEFAGDLGFEYADDPAGELLTKGASTYAQQLAPLLRFHASKSVLPSSALKDGSTVTTLLPGGSFKVARDEGGDDGGDAAIELLVPLVDLATKAVDTESTDALSATDLTFERGAAYKGGGRYVVHAVERVLVPPALADSLRGVTAAVAKSRPQSGSSGSGSGSSGSSSGSGSKPAAAAPAPSPPSRG